MSKEKSRESCDLESEKNKHDQACDVVLMLLSSGNLSYLSDRVQVFYQTWCPLTDEERVHLNEYVSCYMPAYFSNLYQALLDAFNLWDRTQDEIGAPGWDCKEIMAYIDNSSIQNDLKRLLCTTETIWSNYTKAMMRRSPKKYESIQAKVPGKEKEYGAVKIIVEEVQDEKEEEKNKENKNEL